MEKLRRTKEFAELTGVTVRTLRHYDRLGLLRPHRNGSGYRLYGERELHRLEQIVALKFIGIPLSEIRTMLDRNGSDLGQALRRQRIVLNEKRRLLDRAIQAIASAEAAFANGGTPDTSLLTNIIEVIEMQNQNWGDQYYSPEAQSKIKERAANFTPEMQSQAEAAWRELFRDVEAALGEDPASPKAQALGKRWKDMVGQFTGGDPQVAQGLNKLYADRPNWPADVQQHMSAFSNPKVWEFMSRVLNCPTIAPR